jgi:hypothetical protein
MEVGKYCYSPSVLTTEEGLRLFMEQEAGWATLFGSFGNTEKSLAPFSNHSSATVQSAAYPLHAVLYRGSYVVHVAYVNSHYSLLGLQKYLTFFAM